MLETIILSIISFIGTNIDDMLINMFFFSLAKGKEEVFNIIIGKYIAIGTLILISMISSFGVKCISIEYIKYLGLIPIILGIRTFRMRSLDDGINNITASKILWNVTMVTIANGADNIGVYIPLFARFTSKEYGVFLLVFIIMIAIWSIIAFKASKISFYENLISKYKNIMVPVIYIVLGCYILI